MTDKELDDAGAEIDKALAEFVDEPDGNCIFGVFVALLLSAGMLALASLPAILARVDWGSF